MPEQNSKLLRPEKVSKLQKKFMEVEGLAETVAQSDLLQSITNSTDDPPSISANAHIEEEIVLWKRHSNEFRSSSNVKGQSSNFPTRETEWEQFAHNIRFMAPPNADVVFSNVPKNTDGMGKLFQSVCRILKKYPDFFNLSSSQKFRGSTEPLNSSGRCSVLFGLDVEALKANQTIEEMRVNQDAKLKVLRFLYQIKCREETDEIKIQLQHNKSTLEASEFIVIVFVHTPVVEKVEAPVKTTQSKLKPKSNVPLEM
ncbi:MAG: hypothetical protein A2X86_05290 [Bdellovibrionales bacterium GWA2_49_15]|nr:MAG: hypothetical protein A2X86_05290 [Bdellovibrionales bacterium GWA2_49_15]